MLLNANPAGPQERRGLLHRYARGWLASKRRWRGGLPCVGNASGGRLDAEEQAHGRGEHGGAGEGSAVDLGEGGAVDEDWVD